MALAFVQPAGHATIAAQRHGYEVSRAQSSEPAGVPGALHAILRHPRHRDAHLDRSSPEASFSRGARMCIAAIATCGAACTQRSSALWGGRSSPSTRRAASEGGADESPNQENEQPKGWRSRFAAWWRSNAKMDRNKLAKMGLLCLLSYGWVSNTNAVILITTSTYRAVVATGASPLNNAAALKQFGITYAGLYVISNLIRPIRISIALAIAPVFERVADSIQKWTGCKRWMAITLTVIIFNLFGTCALLYGGFCLVSWLTGVPISFSQLGSLVKAGKAARTAS